MGETARPIGQLQPTALVTSPLTGGKDVSLIGRMDCSTLISEYHRVFGMDISKLVGNHTEIALYQCNETKYRFYHPDDIVGDSAFYHQLEANDWYYMRSKWEFDESLKFLSRTSKVLEIGCGRGAFLAKAAGVVGCGSCTGLELNEEAAYVARRLGINVMLESSAEHVRTHLSYYDVVASFQVLEHLPRPMNFLEDAIGMLKPDGFLIIGVPDNSERSVFVRTTDMLNMPPHHQALWDVRSLSYLSKLLPLRLEYLAVEPAIASHHRNSYRALIKMDLMRSFGKLGGWVLYALGRPFYNHALDNLKQFLPAHSVLAVFRKRSQ